MSEEDSIDLLLVGASPPPFHGQALITGTIFEEDWSPWRTRVIEARFSNEIDDVGGLQFRKLVVLFQVAAQMLKARFFGGARVLYITAGSANWVPLIRDAFLIGVVGFLFEKKIVHYHSGGLPEWFEKVPFAGLLGCLAYGRADISIALSKDVSVPSYGAGKTVVVPNGLSAPEPDSVVAEENKRWTMIFIGSLRESKGVGVILSALSELSASEREGVLVRFLGGWSSEDYRSEVMERIEKEGLKECVLFEGVVTGERKWQLLKGGDVFVFPSHYESENQPLVVIEAMAMGLPIIASRWRGIPELLQGGEFGRLIEPKDASALTAAIRESLFGELDSEKMRDNARESYLEQFNQEAFLQRVSQVFEKALSDSDRG